MEKGKMFLLFSHKLSDEQKKAAYSDFGIDTFVSLPAELQNIWSNIDPDKETLYNVLVPLKTFLNKKALKNDVVLIQGDFGAVWIMVQYCKEKGFKAVYATTRRNVVEYRDKNGKDVKKSIFEFRRFREYGK